MGGSNIRMDVFFASVKWKQSTCDFTVETNHKRGNDRHLSLQPCCNF